MLMKKLLARLLAGACAFGMLVPALARAEQKAPKEADLKKVEAALPDKAPAKPEKSRKVLIFNRVAGFPHSSRFLGAQAMKMLGEKTGAFEGTVSDDASLFDTADKLKDYDGIILVSTTQNFLEDKSNKEMSEKRLQNLLEFVKGGKGLVGIHAASDAYYGSHEYMDMIGGSFSTHHAGNEKIAVVNEDPSNPIMAAFDGKNFNFADEIYRFYPESRNHKYQPFSRKHVHVLLSVDITKNKNDQPGTDMPVAWIHRVGEGRVFYSSLGHNEYVFWNPQILKFYLAGIQYSLGDLKANDAPGGSSQASAR